MPSAALLGGSLPALAASALVAAALVGARRNPSVRDRGWPLMLAGASLLLIGSVSNLALALPGGPAAGSEGLRPAHWVALLGQSAGMLALALGLWRWLPRMATRREREERLRQTNEELEKRLRRGSKEMQLDRLRSEMAVRRHKRAARRSEDLITLVAESAPMALVATGLEGRISLAAGRSLRTLGLDPESEPSLPASLPQVAESLSEALRGNPAETTIRIARLSFQVRVSPLFDDDGQVTGAILVANEITALVRSREELVLAKETAEHANMAKSRFLANMSHELRTPLNSVIGFARLLGKDPRGVLESKELVYLERIRENGLSLLALINDILDLSKIEAGHLSIETEPVDVAALAREAAEHLRGQVREGVELEVRAPDAPRMLETDGGRLRQVVLNLVSNAAKFTHAGRIEIRLESDPESDRPEALSVIDTGIGIPADRLGAIFEPFRQVDASTSRQYGGTGLGLGICHSLCHRLGFGLGVESQLDEGSRFTITFGSKDGTFGSKDGRAPSSSGAVSP